MAASEKMGHLSRQSILCSPVWRARIATNGLNSRIRPKNRGTHSPRSDCLADATRIEPDPHCGTTSTIVMEHSDTRDISAFRQRRRKGYYSYDLGAWHVLNSECQQVGGWRCMSSSSTGSDRYCTVFGDDFSIPQKSPHARIATVGISSVLNAPANSFAARDARFSRDGAFTGRIVADSSGRRMRTIKKANK